MRPRRLKMLRHYPAKGGISKGRKPGEVVEPEGIKALHPGQKVRLLGLAR